MAKAKLVNSSKPRVSAEIMAAPTISAAPTAPTLSPGEAPSESSDSYFPWASTVMLGIESGWVIGLRVRKLALGGPEAYAETHRMIAEKVDAVMCATGSLVGGCTPADVVAQYRERVAANTRRLA